MVRKITILSLFLFFSFTLFAQDVDIRQKSPSSVSIIKPNISPKKSYGGNQNGIQSLYYVLPSNNFYLPASAASVAPTGQYNYERCVYLIKPSEMQALGIPSGVKVNQIAWTYYIPGAASVTGSIKIYLQNTSDTTSTKVASWATDISTMTLVDNNSSFTIASTDYSKIENFSLPTAFTYTGRGIYVAFDYSSTTTTTGCAISITTVSAGTSGSRSKQSNTAAPTTVSNTNGDCRPETYLGFAIANDLEVMQVYTLGKLPIPFAVPHQIIAAIGNNGSSTVTNKNVTLTITGANTYSEVVQIASLASGSYTEVTFSNWTPVNAGTNTITVSIPSDDIAANNTKTVTQLITTDTYNYAYGPFPPTSSGGVGFSTTTGDFAAKFYTSSPVSVDQVSVNFYSAGQPYKVCIWDATGTGGTPGSLLWQSASHTAVAGITAIAVSPKVHVNGKYFVGIRQTGTTNLSMGYQSEDPIRDSTFYLTIPAGSTTWSDFAPGNNFRLMIEPRLTLNDVGVSSIDFPVGGSSNNVTTNVAPKATISNYGAANQSTPFNVTMDILDPGAVKVYSVTKSVTLNTGAYQQITFDAAFNPSVKSYTANCYTSLGTDVDATNNLKSVTFNYSQFSLNLTALVQGLYDGSSMISDTITVELRDTSAPYLLKATQKVVLNSSGTGIANFTAPLNSIAHYFIVIKHRNSIETWSASGNVFSPSVLSYDFTTAATKSYGSNMILKSGKYCIYSGDVNNDGIVDLNDLVAINNDNSNYTNGYGCTDVDGNCMVDLSDLIIVDNNSSNYIGKQTPPGATLEKPAIQILK
jgi:hypothetical protein